MPYQKLRAGLGLLTDGGGNKAIVATFSNKVVQYGLHAQAVAGPTQTVPTPQDMGVAAHGANCGNQPAPVNRHVMPRNIRPVGTVSLV